MRDLPVLLRRAWPVTLAVAGIAVVVIVSGNSPFRTLDRAWGDLLLQQRFAFRLSPAPDSHVFLVGIDTAALVEAHTTAVEYDTYAELLDWLGKLNVAAIGLDFIMARGGEPEARNVRAAIRRNGRVVLAEARAPYMDVRSFSFAPQEFASGIINISADPDGVYRRYSFGISDTHVCKPSLALAVYLYSFRPPQQLFCPAEGRLAWKELGPEQESLIEQQLPSHPILLNFRSPYTERSSSKNFKYLSIGEFRKAYVTWRDAGADPNQVPPMLPRAGDLVLVGAVATGVGDAGATPFGRFEPFIELHATALGDLLQRRLLSETAVWNCLALVGALVAIAALDGWADFGVFIGIGVTLIATFLVASVCLLVWKDTIIMAITPIGFVSGMMLLESTRRATLVAVDKARLARFFSPRVRDEILRNPTVTQPRKEVLVVLLTDLRNFTKMSEGLGADVIFNFLNQVFEVETKAVLETDGSMEHFVGDQFLAYWGAPKRQHDAADRALKTAATIVTRLEALRGRLAPEIKKDFGYGIGIHMGEAVFGVKGGQDRPDYGILGDAVNAAARIESLTKRYGVIATLTTEVLDGAKAKPDTRFLDRVRVQGRNAALEIHEVLIDPTPDRVWCARRYQEIWQDYYQKGDFATAGTEFTKLASQDPPSDYMAERCHQLIRFPQLPWDGTYRFKEK